MERVRIAVIGAGGIFRGAHLPAYPEIPEAKLIALCDISEQSLSSSLTAVRRIYQRKIEELRQSGDVEIAEQFEKDLEELTTYRDYK
ncbi:MAG TPA: hypothetical protein EYP10_10020, partial [Armatimonadetes bacterium]|nr:hypothetical protein [Armatimonadota bacterium]